MHKSVGIIGGGVIGLCTAYYLQKEGYDITLIDRGDFSDGCSYVNAGMIVPSHVVPLAAPGVIAKGLRWMFLPGSPFSIHPRADKDLLRWAWLFYRSATKKNVSHAIPYLRDISWLSKSLYRQMASEKALTFGFEERGLLMLYQTAAAEKEEAETARLANKAGVQADILSAAAVQKLEPDLQVSVKGGIYFPGDAHLNPGKFMQSMKEYLKANGAVFLPRTVVTGFEKKHGKITGVITAHDTLTFDEVVIACGAGSGLLAKKLNITLPVQGGKGYSFTLENLYKNIHIPALLTEGRVAVTPMGNCLRVGGTMEIGHGRHTIRQKHIQGIVETLYRFYPGLKDSTSLPEKATNGLRPCSPDGLPYIGRLKKNPNVIIATGHGMMGMSLGPATGKLASELITGRETSMDITAFDPERFAGK